MATKTQLEQIAFKARQLSELIDAGHSPSSKEQMAQFVRQVDADLEAAIADFKRPAQAA